jgi:hypothetical protein
MEDLDLYDHGEPRIGVTSGSSIGQEHAYYVGSRAGLYGKGALIRFHGSGRVGAQFDDGGTGLAHGWHPFTLKEFQPTGPRPWAGAARYHPTRVDFERLMHDPMNDEGVIHE